MPFDNDRHAPRWLRRGTGFNVSERAPGCAEENPIFLTLVRPGVSRLNLPKIQWLRQLSPPGSWPSSEIIGYSSGGCCPKVPRVRVRQAIVSHGRATTRMADTATSRAHPEAILLSLEPDIVHGPLLVRPSAREIEVGGTTVTIEPRVMQVLVALAREPGRVVSRDELVERCWEGRIVGDDAITRCIGALRKSAHSCGDAFEIGLCRRSATNLCHGAICNRKAALRPDTAAMNLRRLRRHSPSRTSHPSPFCHSRI